jgi:phage portal protein BeeE
MAEFQISKKDPDHPNGKRPITRKDPPEREHGLPPWKAMEVLEKPNNDDHFGDLMYRWVQQMLLTGMSLTWMVPNKMGVPFELYSIPTAIAIPQPVINPDYPNGFYRIQPVYPYGPFSSYPTPASAVGAPIPAEWMMRFKFPHPLLRYDGFAPLTALRLHLDEVEQMDRSRWYAMKRVISPSGILQFKDMEGMQGLPEAEIERIRAEFENEFQGTENTGKLMVSTPGAELDLQESRLRDMEYKDGWSQLTEFALAGLGIMKSVAGMTEDTSYASLFAALKQFHLLTLEPWINRIAACLTRFFLPFFGDDLIMEIRCKRIDDHDVRNGKISAMVQAKCITKNEVRLEMDMPATKEKWGEDIAGTEPQQEGAPGAEGAEGGVPGMPGAEGGAPGAEGQPGGEAPAPEEGAAPEGEGHAGESELDEMLGAGGGEEEEGLSELDELLSAAGEVDSGDQGEEGVPEEEEEPEEVTESRPKPGKLGEGSLGPRKSLLSAFRKVKVLRSKYKALSNGVHK